MDFKVRTGKLKRSSVTIVNTYSQLNHANHAVEHVRKHIPEAVDPDGNIKAILARSSERLELCRNNARALERAIEEIAALYETTEQNIVANKRHRGPDYRKMIKVLMIPGVLSNPYLLTIGPIVDPDNSIGLNPIHDILMTDLDIELDIDYDEKTKQFDLDMTYDITGPDGGRTVETLPDGTTIEEVSDQGHGELHWDFGLLNDEGHFDPTSNSNFEAEHTGYSYTITYEDGSNVSVATGVMTITGASSCALYDESGNLSPHAKTRLDGEATYLKQTAEKRFKGENGEYSYIKNETKIGTASVHGGTITLADGTTIGTANAGASGIEERVAVGYHDANGVTRERGTTFSVLSIGAGTGDVVIDDHSISLTSPEIEDGVGVTLDYTVDYGDAQVFDNGRPDFDELREIYKNEMDNYGFVNLFNSPLAA